MHRILAIDYGQKRTGLAHTDPLKMFATPLHACLSSEVLAFLDKYLAQEPVEKIILGYPKNLQNTDTHATSLIEQFQNTLSKRYPNIPVILFDERFTSKMAQKTILSAGLNKSKRQNKLLVDKTASVILLQSYLESQL